MNEYDDAPNVAGWEPTIAPPPPEPTVEMPDVAPNVSSWTPQSPPSWMSVASGTYDPYSRESLSQPYQPPAQSYYGDDDLARRVMEPFGLFASLAPDTANPVVQELARPVNYLPLGGGLAGVGRGVLASVGGRLAGDYAMEQAAEANLPEWAQVGVGLGAGLLGGGLAATLPDMASALGRSPAARQAGMRLATEEAGGIRAKWAIPVSQRYAEAQRAIDSLEESIVKSGVSEDSLIDALMGRVSNVPKTALDKLNALYQVRDAIGTTDDAASILAAVSGLSDDATSVIPRSELVDVLSNVAREVEHSASFGRKQPFGSEQALARSIYMALVDKAIATGRAPEIFRQAPEDAMQLWRNGAIGRSPEPLIRQASAIARETTSQSALRRLATEEAGGIRLPFGRGEQPPRPEIPQDIADLMIPGTDPGIAALKLYEGAVNTRGLEIRKQLDAGNALLRQLDIGTPTGKTLATERTPEMEQLFKALHGETVPPARLQGVYDALKGQVDAETAATVGFDPKFMPHPDYFPRGWRTIEIDGPNPSRAQGMTRGAVGATPGFKKPRVDATFSEILDRVYTRDNGSTYRLEPVSWNPFEQMALREAAGVEFREQTKLVDWLRRTGAAVVADGPLPEGYRVPEVGPAFEGKPKIGSGAEGAPSFFGFTDRVAVPAGVADVLENMFGKRVSLGRTVDMILDAGLKAKQAKLIASLFQQVDFSTRTGFSTFGGAIDDVLSGHPISAVAKVIGLPVDIGRLLHANVSSGRRAALRDEILSGKAIFPERPGITLRGVSEQGWSQSDISVVRRDIRQAFNDATLGKTLTANAKRNIGRLNALTQRGLFDGVYPQAQTIALKNHILPRIMRQHPDWNDQQIMALAADEVNKAFSTLGDYQTIFKNPFVQRLAHSLIFSTNEPEALLKGAFSTVHGPSKKLWLEYYAGGALFLGTLANLVHMASTLITEGRPEPLPADRYIPLKRDDRTATGFSYNSPFLSPNVPFRGEGGRKLTLDLMGQMDTAFRVLDPLGFLKAREGVLVRAVSNQITGTDYFGNRIDTVGPKGIVSRAAQFASDIGEPIGAGQLRQGLGLNLGTAHEPVGGIGAAVQAAGLNLRPEPLREQIAAGGYADLEGPEQLKGIRTQVFSSIKQANPELLGEYNTMGEFKVSFTEDLYQQFTAAGEDPNDALNMALEEVSKLAVVKQYTKDQTPLENIWIAANPEEAKRLDYEGQRRKMRPTTMYDVWAWVMTDAQRKLANEVIAIQKEQPQTTPTATPKMAEGGIVEDGEKVVITPEQWKTVLEVIKDVVRDESGKMVEVKERHAVPDRPEPQKRVVKETHRSDDGKIARVIERHQEMYA